ncbi:MAG: hypothetical protein HQL32_16805 [Planctomycetes bacterium]|nr:hypothetical protein [Planctomycetota bacterium]
MSETNLSNPFAKGKAKPDFSIPGQLDEAQGLYEDITQKGFELTQIPKKAAPEKSIRRQHSKGRMTIWERMELLSDEEPIILFQNWGKELDGGSLLTAIIKVAGRDVALYGHDFTIRAGSMDATNGRKLAKLFHLAGKRRIPVVGFNDSAGAFVPAGVGGLDGYAEAFAALRKISGIVPSIMCMFGYNAGGGSYLPRQGSFLIQPKDTFFGLTGPSVVNSVLGENVSADELGGPGVHGQTGVSDFVVPDEAGAIRKVKEILAYLPSIFHGRDHAVVFGHKTVTGEDGIIVIAFGNIDHLLYSILALLFVCSTIVGYAVHAFGIINDA